MTPPTNPYPGLRPFQRNEAGLFVGREPLLEDVVVRARLAPVTVLFGRSGLGKSSFLTCKVMAALEDEDSEVELINEWGKDPTSAVEARLAKLAKAAETSGHEGLPILLLDQFEDVFKRSTDLRPLWRAIGNAAHTRPPRARVLISMREEWLGAWWDAAGHLAGAASSMVRLSPLNEAELTRAILDPAKTEGSVTVDPKLCERLLRDLKHHSIYGMSEYVEPGMLQIVCHRLWDEAFATTKKMTADLYDHLGGSEQLLDQYIWRPLGRSPREGGLFDPGDRVMWMGVTRHLTAATGSKAIVTPRDLATQLRLDDLGISGPAVVSARAFTAIGYLSTLPERRGDPPKRLVQWILDVLNRGVEAQILKRHQATAASTTSPGTEAGTAPGFYTRFELAHDALASMLQRFAVRLETWIRSRVRRRGRFGIIGSLVLLGILAPAIARVSGVEWDTIAIVFVGVPTYLIAGTALFALLPLMLWRRGKEWAMRGAVGGTVEASLVAGVASTPRRQEGNA